MPAMSIVSPSFSSVSAGSVVSCAAAIRERFEWGSASICASSLWMCTLMFG